MEAPVGRRTGRGPDFRRRDRQSVLDDLRPAAVLCEGGPTLLRQLAAANLLDEVLLTVAPLIAGGSSAGLLAGDALAEPLSLSLVGIARADDHLFLHYQR